MRTGFVWAGMLSLASISGRAQTVQYSTEEKFSARSQEVEVIGKAEGISFARIASRNGSEIIAFRPDMKVQWRKALSFGRENEVVEEIWQRDSGFIVFYTWREKNVKTTAARLLSFDLKPDSFELVLDTFMRQVVETFPEYTFVESDDRSKILCYYTKAQAGRGDRLSYTVMDDSLNVLSRETLELPTSEKRSEFKTALVSDEGEVFVVISEYADALMIASRRFWILRSSERMMVNDLFSVGPEDRWMNNLRFKVDNANRHIVATGFYSRDQRHQGAAEGVMFVVFDLVTRRKISESFNAFAPEFIAKIKGTRHAKYTSRLYTFIIDDVILRLDGGAIIVAESYHKTVRPRMPTGSTDPYGPYSFGETSTTYYFEEMLVMSLTPAGDVHWKNVLIKSQVSSGDNGRFSSYVTMNTGAKIAFIFNDEIRYRTNLVQYTIDPAGMVEREIIFNARKYDLFMMPQFGKQVSAREMIIPSYKKGKLRFVKLNY